MKGELDKSPHVTRLATSIALMLVPFATVRAVRLHRELTHADGRLRRDAVIASRGGFVGAVPVFVGFNLVRMVGAGPVDGTTIAADSLASLALGRFGPFRIRKGAAFDESISSGGRAAVNGDVTLIANF